ncbi:tRNA lysidine(34) synthetase TilS [Campylobacter fetus]|uniref:tRNA lysidine(34) synthetase TilS n=1 Tax=Campylobacter fetus TaxID=196 RepID=UPI0005090EE1|nr:tRNA lysidine(34) synthetase TilS [Campylobacter fetus]AIR79260.1 tRNA(Ile)-lysidine synthetase [Campylobacter fetus subsp. fetus 04/554]EAJ5693739.1 tRNA lysidine(34) synthetase TilS [Campylobacter fetus]EAJ5704025.1 tRNA lysidine(34) synthetase TilS [Campylobacter fetus]EAJ9256564.1 tRNA lysidine(34) synthetase TilS [Campylobacter fetus]EAK0815502.1 tRNA lysidine(34) synthetase TilS [Campylobacter fetus]
MQLLNLDSLHHKKCLLAFSYGTDSTALFHILNEKNIEFDCAFINYKTRVQSDEEEVNAKELCLKFNKNIYIKIAPLNLENGSNFEKKARDIRHKFFDEICIKFNYDTLILAHQLNDCLEWLFMQLSKGSGTVQLCGLEPTNTKIAEFENIKKQISVIRPLINVSRNEIISYLKQKNINYFTDISNFDFKFKRNFIRANFSDAFIEKFEKGVIKSFEFLRADRTALLGEFIYEDSEFFIIEKSINSINLVDLACKKLDVLMSQSSRKQCLKNDCVISHKVCVTSNETNYFVAPFIKQKMDKKFKEKCRVLRIPPLLRGYLSQNQHLMSLFEKHKPLS